METPSSAARPEKIAIMGGGRIGMELFKELIEKGMANEIVVWNRTGKENDDFKAYMTALDQAIDIQHRTFGIKSPKFRFTTNMEDAVQGAQINVLAGGRARIKGEKRSALLADNSTFIDPIAEVAKKVNPNATYIVGTNPVDTMTQRFQEKSSIPHNQIIGLSGELDKARLRQAIRFQAQVPPDAIIGDQVIGVHSDADMIPLLDGIKIRENGHEVPLIAYIESKFPEDANTRLKEIWDATAQGGSRQTNWREDKSSDYLAPASALLSMVHGVINNREVTGSVYHEKEGVYIGAPAKFEGSKVIRLPLLLTTGAKTLWDNSVTSALKALTELPGRVATAVKAAVGG